MEEVVYCPRCGRQRGEAELFCPRCGQPLTSLMGAPIPVEIARSPAAMPGLMETASPLVVTPTLAEVASPPDVEAPVDEVQAVASPYGGFWVRFLAYLMDLFGVWLTQGIVEFVVGLGMRTSGVEADLSDAVANLVSSLMGLVYWIATVVIWGGTPGKLALGYRIVGNDGRYIGVWHVILRDLAQILSLICVGLGYVWIGIDARKQGWHDKLVGTYVVRREFVLQSRRTTCP